MKFSPAEFQSKLPLPATEKWPQGVWDIEAFRHGSMSAILYTPRGTDYQTPHDQDELYIVLTGSGVLEVEGKRFEFSDGDLLFVRAGEHHRFVESSENLAMWATFYGAVGGEGRP